MPWPWMSGSPASSMVASAPGLSIARAQWMILYPEGEVCKGRRQAVSAVLLHQAVNMRASKKHRRSETGGPTSAHSQARVRLADRVL